LNEGSIAIGAESSERRFSVAACVLTYNRKKLLARCLDAIAAQTLAPEMIVIVDNGSSDGTAELVTAHALYREGRIRLVRLSVNVGAAAGFERLFREAYAERGCGWAWIMDDDVIPERDALVELATAFSRHFSTPEEVGFFISAAVDPNGNANNVPAVDERLDATGCPRWTRLLADGIIQVRNCGLTSILVPRWILKKVGAPCPDFHIWGEDTDYTLRVSAERPGYLVGRSRILHVRGVPGFLDITTEVDPARIDRFFYLYRNTVYLRRTFWPRRAFWLFLGRAVFDMKKCLFAGRQPFRRAWLVASGTFAGLFFRPHYKSLDHTPSIRDEDRVRPNPDIAREVA
jgi:dTDP-4-dehydrorhamnose reductase